MPALIAPPAAHSVGCAGQRFRCTYVQTYTNMKLGPLSGGQ